MPRATRYEIKNGIYHVINRGAARRHIFSNDYLKILFLECLKVTCDKYKFIVYAYCIMGNHYHLLIKTPEANLSNGMRFLNSTYAKQYNKYRIKDGPIFKCRFKSIYITNERYLFNVTRYIHLNPVSARIVNCPENYEWSSYSAYLNETSTYNVTLLLKDTSSKKYQEFINKGNSEFIYNFYNKVHINSRM